MSTKAERWQLVAETMLSLDHNTTLKVIADVVGLNYQTVCAYTRDPKFRELVRSMTDDALTFEMPHIDKAMVKKAMNGNVPAANYIAKRAGRLTDVIEDTTFKEYLAKLDSSSEEEMEYYLEHGRWPDTPEPMEEPEKVQ